MQNTTLTINQFRAMQTLTVFADPKDSIATVLGSLRVVRDGDQLQFMSTNRYVATLMTIDVPEQTSEELAVSIPVELINKFAGLIKADKVGSVTISLDDNIVTLTNNYGVTLSDTQNTANYPPVNRLFPADTVELVGVPNVGLRLEWLVKLAKIQTPNESKIDKDQPWNFKFYGMAGTDTRPRPAAIMAVRNETKVLIQPNLSI